MARTRRSRGLSPLGSLAPDRLGLPEGRGRELTLEHAWRSVAGRSIRRRTCRITLRRGVLELTVDEKSWLPTLGEVAPGLVARLAEAHPRLGIRRFRVRWEGDRGPTAPSIPLPAIEAPPPAAKPAETVRGSTEPGGAAVTEPVDPRRVMERYLIRSEERRSQKP